MNQVHPAQSIETPDSFNQSPKPKFPPLILWLIAFILGLGGFIIGKSSKTQHIAPTTLPYSVQTTASPHSSNTWQSYSNEKLGFEFQYPGDLTLSTSETTSSLTNMYINQPETGYSDSQYTEKYISFGIGVYNNSNTDKETNFVTESICRARDEISMGAHGKPLDLASCQEDIEKLFVPSTRGGISGIEADTGAFEQAFNYFIFTKNNLTFVISSAGIEGSLPSETARKTLDQILSTFTFVNEEKIVCGGPVLKPCPNGYTCQLQTVNSGNVEETSGICVKN